MEEFVKGLLYWLGFVGNKFDIDFDIIKMAVMKYILC